MKVLVIGSGIPKGINMDILVVAFKDLQYALEVAGIAIGNTTMTINELKLLDEKLKQQSIVYDQPKSKFISKPLNNFRKR